MPLDNLFESHKEASTHVCYKEPLNGYVKNQVKSVTEYFFK